MSTLQELFEEHGSVWLCKEPGMCESHNPRARYFRPIAVNSFGTRILGEKYDGTAYSRCIEDKSFFLLSPSVQRFKYLIEVKSKRGVIPAETTQYFVDEKEVRELFGRNVKVIGRVDSSVKWFDK